MPLAMDDEQPLNHDQVRAFLHEFKDDLPQQPIAWIGEAPDDQPPPGAPEPGSDVDAWLDWRAKEKKKRGGTWYRLEKIARWSGYTIGQLKYKSSLRKPRGTPKTTTKKTKKVERKVK